ncbi:glucokinase, partial [Pseudomonas aeruginosa]
AEVGAVAMAGEAQTDVVLERFFLSLARVAVNAVRTIGPMGCVNIPGGIVPCFFERLIASGVAGAFANNGNSTGGELKDGPGW